MESVSVTMEIGYKGTGEAGSTGDHPSGRTGCGPQVRPDEMYIDICTPCVPYVSGSVREQSMAQGLSPATGRTGKKTAGQEWVGWGAGWTCV